MLRTFPLPPLPLPPRERKRGEVSVAVAILRQRLSTLPLTGSPRSRSAGEGLGVRAVPSLLNQPMFSQKSANPSTEGIGITPGNQMPGLWLVDDACAADANRNRTGLLIGNEGVFSTVKDDCRYLNLIQTRCNQCLLCRELFDHRLNTGVKYWPPVGAVLRSHVAVPAW